MSAKNGTTGRRGKSAAQAGPLTQVVAIPEGVGNADLLDEAVLLSVLSDVKNGDFGARMPLEWTGVAGKIADRLNDIIGANQTLAEELARVSRVVGKEGKLSQRAAFRGSDNVLGDSID
jgi:hypothetical protein